MVSLVRVAAKETLIDRSFIALVPASVPYRLHKKSPTASLLTIELGAGACKDAVRDYAPHVDRDELAELLATPALVPRTRWFDEIAQRYLFEREVCHKKTSRAARFLEQEMAKEAYFLCKEKKQELARRSVLFEPTNLVRHALATIEARLFDHLPVGELALSCHASESTLLRAFRKELGTTPATYQRDRRLDESLLLLRSGNLGVAEVAAQVGYTNVPAFASAFRRKFGTTPSSVASKPTSQSMLPPHGMAPRPRRRDRRSV